MPSSKSSSNRRGSGSKSGASQKNKKSKSGQSSSNGGAANKKQSETEKRYRRQPNLVKMIERSMNQLEDKAIKSMRSPIGITCKAPVYFVLLYSTILCTRAAIETYMFGVIRYVRQRYYVSGREEGLILGVEYFGLVATLIVVALTGRLAHKPVMILCGVLVTCVGAILWATPYFIEAGEGATPGPVTEVPGYYNQLLCQMSYNSSSSATRNPCVPLAHATSSKESLTAYSLICLGDFLIGLGTGLFMTSGFVYIEESQDKNVDVYYGVMLMMYGLGQLLGACVAWWFTSYSINLSNDNKLYDWEPRAWWLGMVIFAGILFFLCWFFLLFPKWMTEPRWVVARRERRYRYLIKVLEWAKERKKRKREQKKLDKQKQRRRSHSGGEDAVDYRMDARRDSNGSIGSTGTVFPPESDLGAVRSSRPGGYNRSGSNSTDITHIGDSSSPGPEGTEFFPRGAEGGALNRIEEEPNEYRANGRLGLSDHSDSADQSRSRSGRTVNFGEVTVQPEDIQFDAPRDEVAKGQKRRLADPRRRKSTRLQQIFDDLQTILTIPEYTLTVLAAILSAYLPAGYRNIVGRYAEAQYGFDYIHAWFYSDGICYSAAQMFGPIIGGVIISRMKLTNIQLTKMILSLIAITSALFLVLFAFGCSDVENKWDQQTYRLNADDLNYPKSSLCYSQCSCSGLTYVDSYGDITSIGIQLEPVCSSDGTRFYSPCHAGCQNVQLYNNVSTLYTNCSCTDQVSSEFCGFAKSDCSIYGGFWVILFVAILAHATGHVCIVILFLRLVPEELRNLSLGFGVWAMIVCAYVPGTAVFRAIEDSACTLEQRDCFDENVCWRYDLNKYRYVIHGAVAAFQVASLIVFIIVFIIFKRKPNKAHQRITEDVYSSSRQEMSDSGANHSNRNSASQAVNNGGNELNHISNRIPTISERTSLTSPENGRSNAEERSSHRGNSQSDRNRKSRTSVGLYNASVATQSTRLTGNYSNLGFQVEELPYSSAANASSENQRVGNTAGESVRYLRAEDFSANDNHGSQYGGSRPYRTEFGANSITHDDNFEDDDGNINYNYDDDDEAYAEEVIRV